MSKEEILKYAKVFSEARGDTYKIHFVNENKTINEPDLWKETLNLIDKLQKENAEQKKQLESRYYHTINARELEKEINNNWEEKIKAKIKVFKKEGSQTSLIIASVLEELLGE